MSGLLRLLDEAARVIRGRADQMATPAARRLRPTGALLFEETPEAYDRTMDIVPQQDFTSRYPTPVDPSRMPLNSRMGPLMEASDEISAELARRTQPGIGTNSQYFYRTGPIYEGMDRLGVDPNAFMRRFASTFAGTSPRTPTERNLINSSMLSFRDEMGIPLSRPVLAEGQQNDVGYGMITGMHPGLTQRLLEGQDVFATNPKPSSFEQNTLGNLFGTTADTHNIRGTIMSFDALYPGQIPRQWFHSDEAYRQYLDEGLTPELLSSKRGLNDSLQSQTVGGQSAQVEYGPMASITEGAAERLGIPYADTQALGWFGMGDQTGLASENKTIVQLLNDRINVTAQYLGIPMEEVARLYGQGRIPLLSVGGAAGLLAMTPDENAELRGYVSQNGS